MRRCITVGGRRLLLEFVPCQFIQVVSKDGVIDCVLLA